MYKYVLCTLFFTLSVMAADQPNSVIYRPATVTVHYVEEFLCRENGEICAGRKKTETLILKISKTETMQDIERRIKDAKKVDGILHFEPINISETSKDLPIHDQQKQCLQAMINQWLYTFVANKTGEVRTSCNDNQQ